MGSPGSAASKGPHAWPTIRCGLGRRVMTARPDSRRRRIGEAYARFVEPRASGLPNWRVVVWFPGLLLVGAIALIALEISGTSSGAHWLFFGVGDDPRLLLGGPRPIRSDEWLVQQSWIVSQFQQGFPVINRTLPGGMDATVLNELPTLDWSTIFRPHMWGYILFGLNVGTAWQWWIPALGLVSGSYLFVVTLAPRRAITAALLACAVFFSPIFQWWYGPNGVWPTAWALLAMTAVIWALKDNRRWVRIVWAVLVGWLAVTMAIGLYIPFMVPPLIIAVFVIIGAIVNFGPRSRARVTELFARLGPIVVAGLLAGGTVIIFVLTRAGTFAAIQNTVYPGERSDPSGQLLVQDPYLAGIGGAAFGQSFKSAGVPTLLGPNPSEAATAIAFAAFVLPAVITLVIRRARRERTIDWLSVGAIVGLGVILAFMFIPGWDAVSRLLLLDRVPVSRMRVVFAVTLPVFFALIVREVDRVKIRRPWTYGGLSAVLATALTLVLLGRFLTLDPKTLAVVPLWPVVAVAISLAVFLVFYRRWVTTAAGAILLASLIIGAVVNPLYRGIFNLNDTKIGHEVAQVEKKDPGTWVGVGDYETMAVLVESGVQAFDGVQPYPPKKMWNEIDPNHQYENAWNRLAHVNWAFGPGEPVVTDPERDQLLVTFDACSVFAQSHVQYVLADVKPPSEACLSPVETVKQGVTTMTVYEVVRG